MATFPVPKLKDGRSPVVSNPYGYKTGGAYAEFGGLHPGCDILFPANSKDPPFRKGSHERSKNYYMPTGHPVVSFMDGIVDGIASGQKGTCVRIKHNKQTGFSTVYCHLVKVVVKKGGVVKEGQVIGELGPYAPGSLNHLHFELWPTGKLAGRIDPAPYIKQAVIIAIKTAGAAIALGATAGLALMWVMFL